MAKGPEKARREVAIEQELAARRAAAERACPLSRAELHALLDHLAERIATEGHRDDFSYTRAWASENSRDEGPILAFLETRGIDCDWAAMCDALVTRGDATVRRERPP